MAGMCGSRQHAQWGAESQKMTSLPGNWGSKQKVGQSYGGSKPGPGDVFLPARLHHLPKVMTTRDHVFKYLSLLRAILIQTPTSHVYWHFLDFFKKDFLPHLKSKMPLENVKALELYYTQFSVITVFNFVNELLMTEITQEALGWS